MSDDKNENGQTWSGVFSAFRDEGGPTLYGHNRTPVTVDVLEIGFVFAAGILALSFLLILPAYRGCGGKSVTLLKIVIGVFVTLVIFLCNFGQEWEVAHIHTKTIYRAGSKHEIDADIGVKIGLRSVNITLKGKPEYQKLSEHETEQINYNERFDWSVNMWEQGRGGFGPFASAVNQEFREAQFRGAPYPILWIAEYFTIDGEGIRWGRFYRQAGFYAHIMMWLAFPCWVLALILFQSVLFYGVMFSWLTAACHFVACLIFACVRNPLKLNIPFEDDTLDFTWGWTFYLSIVNGLICFILGLVVFVMDLKYPDDINTFFGNDALNDLEEFYVSADELKELGIEIDTGSPSGGSVSTTVESLNGSVRSIKSLLNGKGSNTVSPAFKGPVKRISSITIPDIDEEDGEVLEGKEVIQMFRRKTKSIHNLAHRLKNLQIKSKSDGLHLQTAVPAPESSVMPDSPVYKNVDSITEEEPQGEVYENVDVKKGAQNSNNNNQRVPFRLLPEGQTIRAKSKGPVERRKNKKH